MKKIISFSITFLMLAAVFIPAIAGAQAIGADGGVGSGDPADSGFQLVPCTGVKNADGSGKECDFGDLLILFRRLLQFTLFILTPIMIGMLVYTGFKYMSAHGDVNLIADAKRMFKPIIFGIILICGAWVFVYTVLDRLLAPTIGDIPKSDIVPSSIRP